MAFPYPALPCSAAWLGRVVCGVEGVEIGLWLDGIGEIEAALELGWVRGVRLIAFR